MLLEHYSAHTTATASQKSRLWLTHIQLKGSGERTQAVFSMDGHPPILASIQSNPIIMDLRI